MTTFSQPFRRPGSFKDRDYLETWENLVFCVVGEVHPPGKAFAYLKYMLGEDKPNRVLRFYSVPHVEETMKLLAEKHPEYLFKDPYSGIVFPAVPESKVKVHHKPEAGVARILSSPRDPLEAKAARLVKLLSSRSKVPLERFGITGSILLGIHNLAYSDIDLIVYGLEESLKVKDALESLYLEEGSQVEKFKGERLKAWCLEKSRLHPLTFEEAEEIYRRTWNRGTFEGTMFSVHPVKADYEVEEAYGEVKVEGLRLVEGEACIADSRESIFLPAVYKVERVEIPGEEESLEREVLELVSFEGLYGGIFQPGERVRFKGLLERVESRRKGSYFRVVVGSKAASGSDYIKPSA